MKKIQIPFVSDEGVTTVDGYQSPTAGIGIYHDTIWTHKHEWRLVHLASGYVMGAFRTRKVAARAAELHAEFGVDWTQGFEELRKVPGLADKSDAASLVATLEDSAAQEAK
jgi:hypothetical protein